MKCKEWGSGTDLAAYLVSVYEKAEVDVTSESTGGGFQRFMRCTTLVTDRVPIDTQHELPSFSLCARQKERGERRSQTQRSSEEHPFPPFERWIPC
jgi:hypothetical protein